MDTILVHLSGQFRKSVVFEKIVGPFADEESAIVWLMDNDFTHVDRGIFHAEGKNFFHTELVRSPLAKHIWGKFVYSHDPERVRISPEEKVEFEKASLGQ